MPEGGNKQATIPVLPPHPGAVSPTPSGGLRAERGMGEGLWLQIPKGEPCARKKGLSI